MKENKIVFAKELKVFEKDTINNNLNYLYDKVFKATVFQNARTKQEKFLIFPIAILLFVMKFFVFGVLFLSLPIVILFVMLGTKINRFVDFYTTLIISVGIIYFINLVIYIFGYNLFYYTTYYLVYLILLYGTIILIIAIFILLASRVFNILVKKSNFMFEDNESYVKAFADFIKENNFDVSKKDFMSLNVNNYLKYLDEKNIINKNNILKFEINHLHEDLEVIKNSGKPVNDIMFALNNIIAFDDGYVFCDDKRNILCKGIELSSYPSKKYSFEILYKVDLRNLSEENKKDVIDYYMQMNEVIYLHLKECVKNNSISVNGSIQEKINAFKENYNIERLISLKEKLNNSEVKKETLSRKKI